MFCFTNITATHYILNDSQFPVNEVEYLLFSSISLPVTMHTFWQKHRKSKQTQLLVVRENVTVAWITRVWWDNALEKNKSNKRTYFSREKKTKRLSKLEGESQRLINQPAMKAAVLMGRRQKANCAAQRARLTTLQTLSVPCRNFYEQRRYCSEREEVWPGNNETLVYC